MSKENINTNSQAHKSIDEVEKQSLSSCTFGGSKEGASIINDDQIDLIDLLKMLWDGRKRIYYTIGVCFIIGIGIAFFSPLKYRASATLLPSTQKKSNNLGNLSSLASMAGVNLGSMMGQSEGISPEIYPQIVNSYPFLNEFIHEKFLFKKYDNPISIYNYVLKDTIPTIGSYLYRYTIGLPTTIKNIFISKRNIKDTGIVDYGVLNLSQEEMLALSKVNNLFSISVNDETGLINISVETREPVLSAQYVQKAVELLQKFIVEYKTKQLNENLKFIQEQYDKKEKEYELAQLNFFKYKDGHRNIISERINPEFQRLSDIYEIASSIYKSLAQQLEQGKLAVKENTPVYSILEPVRIPSIPSNTRRSVIILLSIIVGSFSGVLIIFCEKFLTIFKHSIEKKNNIKRN